MKKLIIVLTLLLFTACSKLPPIEENNLQESIFTSYVQDVYGLPYFEGEATEADISKDTVYYYVLSDGNMIKKVYQLLHAAKDDKINLQRSATRIQSWTENGFDFGIDLIQSSHGNYNGKDALFVVFLPAITASTAFVSGVVVSTVDILGEFGRFFIPKKDILLSVNSFYYDPKNRIKYIKTELQDEFATTKIIEFFYMNGLRKPYKTKLTNEFTGEEKIKIYDLNKDS